MDKIIASQAFANQYPHDVSVQYPVRREYFMEKFQAPYDEKQLISQLRSQRETSVYFHIPFCEKKCSFCNFSIDVRPKKEVKDMYIDALVEQAKRVFEVLKNSSINALDIGGGTPTNLEPEQIRRFMEGVREFVRKTDKSNPNTFSAETTTKIAAEHIERLQAYYEGGVRRFSMGVQSTSQAIIDSVHRLQESNPIYQAYKNLRNVGFKRINFDFIFGLPGQTKTDIQSDIDLVSELKPDSVTTYDCVYKGKGRVLKRQLTEAPSRAQYGALYDFIYDKLTQSGYHAEYGSLNFSAIPEESGTSKYFEDRMLKHSSFVGLGNYSSSQIDSKWWFAPYSVDDFVDTINVRKQTLPISPGSFYDLSKEELVAKDLLSAFNFGYIDKEALEAKFGITIEEQFKKEMDFAIKNKWLEVVGNKVRLTKGSFEHLTNIRALFYTENILKWLQNLK